jgi:hypothetical protein
MYISTVPQQLQVAIEAMWGQQVQVKLLLNRVCVCCLARLSHVAQQT